jgi:hypothetical protein
MKADVRPRKAKPKAAAEGAVVALRVSGRRVEVPVHLRGFVVGDAEIALLGVRLPSAFRSNVDWPRRYAKLSAEGHCAKYDSGAGARSLRNGIFPDLKEGVNYQGAFGVGHQHPFATEEELGLLG